MAKRGMEVREITPLELESKINMLRRSDNPNLADVLATHRTVAERDGTIELGRKMWNEIDHHLDIVDTREPTHRQDLTLAEGIDFLASAGMNVVVIDEHGVQDGTLMPDDSIFVEEYPENPDNMTDDEVIDLDRKMDLLLDPRVVYLDDSKTVLIPDEVLAELDPDKELDEAAFPVCGCGCGGRTKGGRYIPGHDAKHKGRLMRTVFYDPEGPAGEAAELELNLRGWMKFYPAFAKNERKRERRRGVARCKVCGRPLSDEESVELGIGPVCAGRHS
jgi:hypothetical protein